MTTIIETDPEVAELILQAVPGSVSVLTTVDGSNGTSGVTRRRAPSCSGRR